MSAATTRHSGPTWAAIPSSAIVWTRPAIRVSVWITIWPRKGTINGWKVEDCYILEQMQDVAIIPALLRVESPSGIVYCFGDTCIRVRESEDNGKIRLELVSGDQTACGEWVELSIDRVYGYCTLLERHLNRKDGNQK